MAANDEVSCVTCGARVPRAQCDLTPDGEQCATCSAAREIGVHRKAAVSYAGPPALAAKTRSAELVTTAWFVIAFVMALDNFSRGAAQAWSYTIVVLAPLWFLFLLLRPAVARRLRAK